MPTTNIERLKTCRNSVARVFKDEVYDDIHDNGNLNTLAMIIQYLEDAIRKLEERQIK